MSDPSGKSPRDRTLVYSTDVGRRCSGCGEPIARCRCQRTAAPPIASSKGPVRVGRETQGRGGKGVTVITGLALAAPALESLARELKSRCGSGGRVVDGKIEIQGEHRDLLVVELGRRGIVAKRSGG
jgi:translation initiation factor 1